MEENTTVTTEDKIAKLKTTLEGMELLGATIPQEVKDAVNQEIATLEVAALVEVQKIEAEATTWEEDFRTKQGVSIYVAIVGLLFITFEVIPAIVRVLK